MTGVIFGPWDRSAEEEYDPDSEIPDAELLSILEREEMERAENGDA